MKVKSVTSRACCKLNVKVKSIGSCMRMKTQKNRTLLPPATRMRYANRRYSIKMQENRTLLTRTLLSPHPHPRHANRRYSMKTQENRIERY